MLDNIKKSKELRDKISESMEKIQEVGFLRKMADKMGILDKGEDSKDHINPNRIMQCFTPYMNIRYKSNMLY